MLPPWAGDRTGYGRSRGGGFARWHQGGNVAMEIASGKVIAHRLLDVADTIDLAQAETLWLAHAGHKGRRTRLSMASAKELSFEVPPTLLALPPATVHVEGLDLQAAMTARVYDFGAIAIALRVDASGLPWEAFVDRCNALDRAVGAASGSALWHEALRSVLDVIGPALRRPSAQHLEEDYLFAVVHRFGQDMTAQQIRANVDLAAVLSG